MKRYLYALIITCIGALIITLNTKEHNPPLIEAPVVEAPVEPIVPEMAQEPIPPAETAMVTPVAQEYSLPDDQAKAYIYQKESNNCPTRWQGEYGPCPAFHGTPTDPNTGYGICQATPGWKMASAGEDWATNYDTQDRWCTEYANSRYGGWQGAYSAWISKKWW